MGLILTWRLWNSIHVHVHVLLPLFFLSSASNLSLCSLQSSSAPPLPLLSITRTTPQSIYTPRTPQLPAHHNPPRPQGELQQPPNITTSNTKWYSQPSPDTSLACTDIYLGDLVKIPLRGAQEYSPRPPILHNPPGEGLFYNRPPPPGQRGGPDVSLNVRGERQWSSEREQGMCVCVCVCVCVCMCV